MPDASRRPNQFPDTQSPDPAVFGDFILLLDAGEESKGRNGLMQTVIWLLTGGWARGYRTQLTGFTLMVATVVAWATGDMTLADLIDKLPGILGGMGLVALGDKVNDVKDKVDDVKESVE